MKKCAKKINAQNMALVALQTIQVGSFNLGATCAFFEGSTVAEMAVTTVAIVRLINSRYVSALRGAITVRIS
jgi:hypothetical protein